MMSDENINNMPCITETTTQTERQSYHMRILMKIPRAGILCSVLANLLLAISYGMSKLVLTESNVYFFGLLRVSAGAFVLLPVLLISKDNPFGKKGERILVLLWGIFYAAAQFLLIYAMTLISATDASTVSLTSSILVPLAAPLVLGETFRRMYVLAAVLCFAGVLLIDRPSFLFHTQLSDNTTVSSRTIGVLLSLATAVADASAWLTNRKIQKTNAWVFTMHFQVISVIGYLVAMFASKQKFKLSGISDYLYAAGSGFVFTLCLVILVVGYQLEEAGLISVVGMVEIPFVLIFQIIFLGDIPLWTTYCGVLLVMAGIFIAIIQKWEKGLEKLKAIPEKLISSLGKRKKFSLDQSP